MEERRYTTIDRAQTDWGAGPWDTECDKIQWPDAATGLPCLAVRHARLGHWCGYVGVRAGHPAFGQRYDDVDVQVHGGLTYAGLCNPHVDAATGICHVPGPGESDHVYWLGFDCAHAFDLVPHLHSVERSMQWDHDFDDEYRTLEYVREECRQLAAQLAAMQKEVSHAR